MSKKLISLILTLVLFTSAVLSSYAIAETDILSTPTLDMIAEEGTHAVAAAEEAYSDNDFISDEDDSDEWKQYIGDIETFAYGLIINQLGYLYDVFPACVDLPDGNLVYGIAYTDYSDCYTNEDESSCLFEAGFIPFNGELPVSQEEIDTGLYITNLDFTDEDTSFIWAYDSGSFKFHCVVYNQYLQYGVDDNGAIFYEASEYIPGVCDESLGSLYSYDEAKYLFDVDVGIYLKITGASLFSLLDYDELEKEINRIIQTQDINFASVDVVSCANFAQGAITSYLLSLQEETFLGYNVAELVEAAKALDPLECYRITADGLVTLKLQEGTPASTLTKWLVGTGCVIVAAVATVGSMVFIECPILSSLAGALSGAAIETFMQVVISNKALDSVDWAKVVVGAVSGAVSGLLGPYIAASGLVGFSEVVVDSAIDGLIGGIERSVEALIDKKDANEIFKSFGLGFGIGMAMSAGFKGVAAGLSKIGQKIGNAVKKLADKCPKLANKAKAIKESIGNVINGFKKKADNTIFHSKHVSKKISNKQMNRLKSKNSDELMNKSIDKLPTDNLVDANGNAMTKDALRDIAPNAQDGSVVAYYKYGDENIPIIKENSMVSPKLDSTKYQSVTLTDGLTSNRSDNFVETAKLLKDKWTNDPSAIPDSIAAAIRDSGKTLEDLSDKSLVSIIQKSDWVIHENIDKVTATLVPRAMHEEIRHMGGVGLSKYLKSHMGTEFFNRLVSAVTMETVIAIP